MTQPAPSPRALEGVKVLDLARVLAGPLCASMLADLGASVTKIEIPGRGDDSRAFSPQVDGESSYFMLVNRGKKSVTIDMKSAEGLDLLRGLIERSDVLVENFRPGVTARLGLDYDSARRINPRLIYVSISGFGQTGPLAHRAAYDHIVQAMGGIMSVTGWPGGPPTRVGDAVGDVVAGIYGSWGVLAALLQRERTGVGQHVDVAMLDTMISLQIVGLSQIVGGAPLPERIGNAHPISAPMDSFAAENGHVVIAVANDALFAKLAGAMSRPDLCAEPRFATDAARLNHRDELRALIEAWTATQPVAAIVDRLEAVGVPAAPIWDLPEALASAHAHERRIMRQTRHPRGGTIAVMPHPVRFSAATDDIDLAAPRLGQHTDDVLGTELGLGPEACAGLRKRGVI